MLKTVQILERIVGIKGKGELWQRQFKLAFAEKYNVKQRRS